MANNTRTNPVQVDSTGGLYNTTSEITISGISVMASNATWAVKLTDAAGNTIYEADNIAGMPPGPAIPFKTTGVQVTTLTNAKILIYTVP